MIAEPWLLALCVFGLLALLGATSGLVNARLCVSEPLACMLGGVALGPAGMDLLRLDPTGDPEAATIMREAARVTLAIAVTSAAIRLPQGWLRACWRGVAVAIGPGMVLMWLVGTAVAALTLELSWGACFLVGAAIAPTDPVLSAPVLTGELARRAVPENLRHGLTAESGVNDGLALPLVMLPILLMAHGREEAGVEWVLHVLLWEVVCAALIGGTAGWIASRVLRWARRRPEADSASLVTVTLALALATLAGVRLLDGDGILAAFFAGAVLNEGIPNEGIAERQAHFNEAFGRFFDLPVMILFGAVIPWGEWSGLGWGAAVFAVGVLLLRRLPVWLLLGRLMPWTGSRRRAAFAGWFGPIGAGALFYALEIQDRTGNEEIWPVVSVAIAASVLLHGITGTPFTWLLGRAGSPAFREAAGSSAKDPLAADGED